MLGISNWHFIGMNRLLNPKIVNVGGKILLSATWALDKESTDALTDGDMVRIGDFEITEKDCARLVKSLLGPDLSRNIDTFLKLRLVDALLGRSGNERRRSNNVLPGEET